MNNYNPLVVAASAVWLRGVLARPAALSSDEVDDGDNVCRRCILHGGATGSYELEQYERLQAAGGADAIARAAPPPPGSAKATINYTVSDIVASGACLAFTITHARAVDIGSAAALLRGGSSFHVRIEGRAEAGGALELCCVRDGGDDVYYVACPRRAITIGRCGTVSVILAYERYAAFVNALPTDDRRGPCRDYATGTRTPPHRLLSERTWCDERAGNENASAVMSAVDHGWPRDDSNHNATLPVGVPRELRRMATRGLLVPPSHTCRSIGVWMRFGPRGAMAVPHAPGRSWWEQRYAFVDACHEQHGHEPTPPPPPLPPDDGQNASAIDAAAEEPADKDAASKEPANKEPANKEPAEELFSGFDLLQERLEARGGPSRGSASPRRSPPRLSSVHFVGESHLTLTVDCFAAGHERRGHLEKEPWSLPHRMEPQPPEWPHDGYLSEDRTNGPSSVRAWADCVGRPASCWDVNYEGGATVNGSKYGPQLGLDTFKRRCWRWRENVTETALHGRAPPLVCKHSATGIFRAALALQLLVSDMEAAVANGHGVPLGLGDVIVVQGGTWDTMCFGDLQQHLQQDVPPLLAALHRLTTSEATRGARVLLLSMLAAPVGASGAPTTGCRSSWSHAAWNAYVARQLRSSPPLKRSVTVLDQLGVTWARHHASPDLNHFVRHRFRTPSSNYNGDKKRFDGARTGFTSPPPRAAEYPCIGDAGMAAARALRDEIEMGGIESAPNQM